MLEALDALTKSVANGRNEAIAHHAEYTENHKDLKKCVGLLDKRITAVDERVSAQDIAFKEALATSEAKHAQLAQETEQRWDKRWEAAQTEVAKLRTSMEGLTLTNAHTQTKVTELGTELGHIQAGTISPEDTASDFDRKPDLGIIRVNSNAPLAKAAVEECCANLCEKMGLPKDCFETRGQSESKTFVLAFKGIHTTAAKRARSFKSQVFDASNQWALTKLQADSGEITSLYFNLDKSGRTLMEEAASRRMAKAVKQWFESQGRPVPRTKFDGRPKKRYLEIKWLPAVRFPVVSADATITPSWEAKAVADLQLDKDAINSIFETLVPSGDDGLQWG